MVTNVLLSGILFAIIIRIIQAELAQRQLMRLLNDLGTMIGEFFPILRRLTGRED